MATKKSIRFYNDRKVRAVWSDTDNTWYFSATDVVRAINDEDDYVKAGNYWRWLKKKLAADGLQLVSGTHDFKFEAPDGKMRTDNSIDGQSRKKAYKCVDWSQIDKKQYLRAMRLSTTDDAAIRRLLKSALTDQIDDRELFMNGIDYSYYYEQEE